MAEDLYDFTGSTSLVDLVTEQVKKTPDSIAVIYDGVEDSSCVRITYSEMWQRADQIFRDLQTLGAQRETVGVCMKPGINVPSILLGILQASSSYMPFGEDGHGFVKHCIQRLGITYLLLDGSALQNLQSLLLELRVRIVPAECLQSLGMYVGQIQGSTRERQLRQVPDLAYCITTSGTTGTPKIVRVPHACIVPNILDFRREFQPCVGDITFLTSPLTFDPSVVDLFMTLSSGAAVLIVAPVVKMSGEALLTMLTSRHKVTILQMTPSLFRSMDAGKVKTSLLSADSPLKVLAFGGERFPSHSMLNDCLHPDNGATVYNVYGITEVSCWASLHKARLPRGCVQDSVPIGKALSGTRVKVVDERGTEVEGGVGHIMIGGSERVSLLNEEDKEVLRSGTVWRATGDVGLVHNTGDIYCLGRNDRQIKRHGKRLDLDTLEKVASQLTTVKDCQAVHREDRLFLFITSTLVAAEGVSVCKEVQNHVQKMLPSQYQPDQVMSLSAFPVNSHGKLDVGLLLQQLKQKTEQPCPSDSVSVDSWACKLWQDITGDKTEAVSPDDSFLSCGGDSLKAVRLVEQVEQRLGQDVPDLLEILLTKTFHEFISIIREQLTLNCSGEKKKSVQHRRNGVSKHVRHVAGNHVDVSEPPVKMRKGSSDKSEGKWLNQEHHSIDSHLNVDTSSHNCTNYTTMQGQERMDCVKFTTVAESLQREPGEGKKRTCHELLDQNTHVDELAQTAEEEDEVFVCSISRANNGWSTEDCVRTCCCRSDVRSSAVNGESKLCSAVEKANHPDAVRLELLWACDTGKCVDASPLVGRTRSGRAVVFIGSHSHHFFAIDVCSGKVLWSAELGDRVESSACLSPCGRRIIVGCYDHKVYVLKAESGIIEWQVTTGDVVKCSPVADIKSHLVFCGSHDGFLYALNCKTQKVAWKSWMGGGGVFASPVLSHDNSSVYTATLRGHVTAVSTMTGTLVWRVCLDKPVFSSPAVHNDHLYVGCVDCSLYCLSCTTGTQLWVYRTQAPIFSSPVIMKSDNSGPYILFGSHDNCLHCISHTGQPVRKHHTTSTVYASPFVFGLCQATENGAVSVFSVQHHTEESGEQGLRHKFSSQHAAKNLKDQVQVRGSELSCDSQLDRNSQKREQQTAFLPELDTKRPVSSNRLKNGGSELCRGQTNTNCQLYKCEEKHKAKSNCSHSARSQICPSKCLSGDDRFSCGQFVACASTDGMVRILNCVTGKLSVQVRLPGEVFSSPLVVDDCLVVGCRDDKVYCYKLGHPS